MKTFDDPRFPRNTLKKCVPEIERQQNHINVVDPNHPLLPIALDCLKDIDGERPSAQQLRERVAALKEIAKYKNACESVKDSGDKEGEHKQLQHVIEELTQQIQHQMQQIQQLERDKRQVERERDQVIQLLKEKDLERLNQQLEESEHLVDS